MPGISGFEVIRNLDGGALPCIVIVTAFDRHAIEAFEAGAIDYLLKPVGQDRLVLCIERVRQLRKNSQAVAESVAKLQEAVQQSPAARPRKVVGNETRTAGYTVFNIGASYTLARQHMAHIFGVDAVNLGDRLYRNHLSFIKDRAPEIGRGVRFTYTVRFF
jgi:DNA-binding response OmpR family regulator